MLGLLYVADAMATEGPGWGVAIGSTGAFGLVCYLLYWLVTKYGPEKDKATGDMVRAIGEKFEAAVNKITADSAAQRATFADEMQRQRQNCREEQNSLVSRLDEKDRQIIELLRGEQPHA